MWRQMSCTSPVLPLNVLLRVLLVAVSSRYECSSPLSTGRCPWCCYQRRDATSSKPIVKQHTMHGSESRGIVMGLPDTPAAAHDMAW